MDRIHSTRLSTGPIAGHIIPNWKNRFFVLQMANEGTRKVFRLLYYKEQVGAHETVTEMMALDYGPCVRSRPA